MKMIDEIILNSNHDHCTRLEISSLYRECFGRKDERKSKVKAKKVYAEKQKRLIIAFSSHSSLKNVFSLVDDDQHKQRKNRNHE